MKARFVFLAAGALAAAVSFAAMKAREVTQKDRKFSVTRLEIKKGESVSFRNMDPFFHNIFSVTPGAEFDLGSFPQGEAKSRTFDKAGTVEVECAFHPEMKMQIEVKD